MTDRRTYAMLLTDSLNTVKIAELIGKKIRKHPIGLIYLDIKRFGEIQKKYGQKTCDRILQQIRLLIVEIGKHGGTGLFAHRMLGDDVFLFLRLEADKPRQLVHRLYELASRIRDEAEQQLNRFVRLPEGRIELYAGVSLLDSGMHRDADSLLYSAVKHAIFEAKSEADRERTLERAEFFDILDRQAISAHYQPIVSLSTGEVYGYESLTRGPGESAFASPSRLFEFAEKEGSLYALEKVSREKAIRGFTSSDPGQKLFINLNANVIHDPNFTPGQTMKLLEQMNLTPQNIVFEITERQSIDDFATFTRVLDYYRKQGYRIAIDDAGAGYSSLQAIAELRPDYIKIDRSIIHGIDRDKVKEILLETLVAFAEKINCRIVAEGIETPDELTKAIRLGAHLGQGYLLGRPQAELTKVPRDVIELIHKHNASEEETVRSGVTIGNIVRPVKTFDEKTVVSDVVAYFNKFENESGAVIVRGNQPVGLIMREKLFQSLASQYGVPLYWKRSIRKLMDGYPLILEEHVVVETASRLAMARDQKRIYDFIVVTRGGDLAGVVTIQSILDTMTTAQIEYAKELNPLTGLPGNRQIERELQRRLSLGHPFSIIYADLDYFKWFNDQFGFQKGDRVIRFLADVLRQAVASRKTKGDFIGHIGGDDFIVITSCPDPADMCEEIIADFDRGMPDFYGDGEMREAAADRQGGVIPVRNRWGETVDAKGVALSLALLECDGDDLTCLSLDLIAKRAGELKQMAKDQLGSVCAQGKCRV